MSDANTKPLMPDPLYLKQVAVQHANDAYEQQAKQHETTCLQSKNEARQHYNNVINQSILKIDTDYALVCKWQSTRP